MDFHTPNTQLPQVRNLASDLATEGKANSSEVPFKVGLEIHCSSLENIYLIKQMSMEAHPSSPCCGKEQTVDTPVSPNDIFCTGSCVLGWALYISIQETYSKCLLKVHKQISANSKHRVKLERGGKLERCQASDLLMISSFPNYLKQLLNTMHSFSKHMSVPC